MHRLALLPVVATLSISCASDPAPQATSPSSASGAIPSGEAPPEPPLTAAELRTKWEPLARDEGQLVSEVSMLATYSAEERVRKLQPVRANAGILASGIGRLVPPVELAACQKRATEGAKKVKTALDGIHEIWMDRAPRDRAAADKLASDLCVGFALLKEGREACGVSAVVATPLLCK